MAMLLPFLLGVAIGICIGRSTTRRLPPSSAPGGKPETRTASDFEPEAATHTEHEHEADTREPPDPLSFARVESLFCVADPRGKLHLTASCRGFGRASARKRDLCAICFQPGGRGFS